VPRVQAMTKLLVLGANGRLVRNTTRTFTGVSRA
jgi:hypothetical protein